MNTFIASLCSLAASWISPRPIPPMPEPPATIIFNQKINNNWDKRCITFINNDYLICSADKEFSLYEISRHRAKYVESHKILCHDDDSDDHHDDVQPFVSSIVCAQEHPHTDCFTVIIAYNSAVTGPHYYSGISIWDFHQIFVPKLVMRQHIKHPQVDWISHLVISPTKTECALGTNSGCFLLKGNMTMRNTFYQLIQYNDTTISNCDTFTYTSHGKLLYRRRLSNNINLFIGISKKIQQYTGICKDTANIIQQYLGTTTTRTFSTVDPCYNRTYMLSSPSHSSYALFGDPPSETDTEENNTDPTDQEPITNEDVVVLSANVNHNVRILRNPFPVSNNHRYVMTVAYSPGESYLAGGFSDGSTVVWETSTGCTVYQMRNKLATPIVALAFSPQQRLATYCDDGQVTIIPPQSFKTAIRTS